MIPDTGSGIGQELAEFVDYLHRGIRKFGIAPIKEKLGEMYKADVPRTLKAKIFEEITGVYGVPKHAIIRSRRRGAVTEAKVMAIILLHKHVAVTQTEIAAMFGCGRSVVGRRIKAFNGVNGSGGVLSASDNAFAKIYENKEFMSRFKDIDTKINEYKTAWQRK